METGWGGGQQITHHIYPTVLDTSVAINLVKNNILYLISIKIRIFFNIFIQSSSYEGDKKTILNGDEHPVLFKMKQIYIFHTLFPNITTITIK